MVKKSLTADEPLPYILLFHKSFGGLRLNLEQAKDPFESDRQLIIDWITEVIEEEYELSVLKDMILPIFTFACSLSLSAMNCAALTPLSKSCCM